MAFLYTPQDDTITWSTDPVVLLKPHTVASQKIVARKVLAMLEVLDPNCILAGGAPRDWWRGVPASDLDFYIHFNHGSEHVERSLKAIGFTNLKMLGEDRPEYRGINGLRYVFETKVDGMTVQIMVMTRSTYGSVLDSFCYWNSKAWWKGGPVRITDEFYTAMTNKVFINSTGDVVKDSYRDKMARKFPTFRFLEDLGAEVEEIDDSTFDFSF